MKVWIGFIALLFSTCDIISPESPLPSYIYVTPFQFELSNNQQGSASQKITEAWLSVDGEFLGVYDLPAKIPILKTGVVNIILEAGVKDNGISTLPEIYPFFSSFQISAALSPSKTDTIRPTISYRPTINFALIEDFEKSSQVFVEELDGNENTKVMLTTDEVFEGNQSGIIELDASNPRIAVASRLNEKFKELQDTGVQVYLEMDYKTDVELGVGLIGHYNSLSQPSERLYEPILFPKTQWNKVYLNLSEVAFVLDADEYQISFIAALPNELNLGNIWLDNIKLIHF